MSKEANPNLHHRRSIRLPDYDYTSTGAYFITILSHEHTCLFGEMVGDQIHLTKVGIIAASELIRLEKRFRGLMVDSWGIMPNHLHVVICLGMEGDFIKPEKSNSINTNSGNLEQFGKPIPGSIPTIIRSYKSSMTQRYRMLGHRNLWQRGYYEHVIRSDAELAQIRRYIEDNPRRWLEDKDYRSA